jgi:type III secretion protein T
MSTGFQILFDGVVPHLASLSLISARLVPIAFLCPLLGGPQTPMHVKLGVTLALAGSLHFAAGVAGPVVTSALDFGVLGLGEAALGTTMGLLASLPFDTARMGGKFIDLFRGSSAEAALPLAGSKEAATGEGLYQLLLAVGAVGGVLPLVLSAIWRSFALVPIGAFHHTEEVAMMATAWVGTSLGTALAIGAPVAALSLATDAFVGLASRAAPNMNLQDVGTPIRILVGGAAVWLGLGVLCDRLLAFANSSNAGLLELLHLTV